MKIVAIMGSPHGMNGNTGKLLEQTLRAAEATGAQVETFLLHKLDIKPCRACDVCQRTGECAILDDFQPVRDAMFAADGVILASPNYLFSVSAQMKTFMDRLCCRIHLVAMEGKHGAAVVTSGGAESGEVIHYLDRFLRAMGAYTVEGVGAQAGDFFNDAARRKRFDEAADLGRRLTHAIATRQTFPSQDAERLAFAERMRFLVEMRKEEWRYEHEQWQKKMR